MKKRLYLMRHGETLFNSQHKIQGWCDSPLTELGKKQANAARKYFEDNDIQFDYAYCSTSERCSDTLEIITDLPYNQTHNKWDELIPFEPLWKQYKRIIKDNGAIVLFGSGMFTAKLMMSNPKMWRYNLFCPVRNICMCRSRTTMPSSPSSVKIS